MESRAKVAGHPIHPMLIVLPLGLLTSALAFDVIHRITDDVRYGETAFRLAMVGLVGGALAWITGLVDYLSIPSFTRAKKIGAIHGVANSVVLTLFVIATVVRGTEEDHLADGLVLSLEIVAILLAAYAGWLGGELVERLGIGVDRSSRDLDAKASLETTMKLGDEEEIDRPRGIRADELAASERHERVGSVESHSKAAGHATHPMLVTFPLGLLMAAAVFDIAWLITDDDRWAHAAFHALAAAVITGVVAMVPGFIDYRHVPADTRARSVGRLHAIGNVVLVAMLALSWLARRGNDDHRPTAVALALSLGAALLSAATGWLGGELHQRLGVGIDPGAFADAPSSLTTRAIDLRDAADVDAADRTTR
ncbi:MAG TPA: DUF2231 domain-containing protein [Mycobacteriales bacterium]|jgi:uncharacterized membrane protein|nr:DUF2231 domain-containing protein [Mycobacteriales bacterium]